jgi:TrkA domain protein
MRVRETQLPGVGVRYNLEFEKGRAFIVVLHNDGHREAFWQGSEEADSERLFKLSEQEARKVSEIFDGTYFHPVAEDLDEALDGARIKWVQLADDSPLAGNSIGEAQIRSRTGVSIIAIQRGDRTISNPDKDELLQENDVLVVVGTGEQHEAFTNIME